MASGLFLLLVIGEIKQIYFICNNVPMSVISLHGVNKL